MGGYNYHYNVLIQRGVGLLESLFTPPAPFTSIPHYFFIFIPIGISGHNRNLAVCRGKIFTVAVTACTIITETLFGKKAFSKSSVQLDV